METLKFADLFCGIGGFRIAGEKVGWECVFSCDIDKECQKIYKENFGELPQGDIRKISPEKVPDFDVLFAGFPCQPFSFNGKRLGFQDSRGTLFFEILRFIKTKQPIAFVLENVSGLKFHDGGKTLSLMLRCLGNEINGQKKLELYKDCLGYCVWWKVLSPSDFGFPQQRKRIFIVGFRESRSFSFPKESEKFMVIEDILEKEVPEGWNVKKEKLEKLKANYNPNREPKEKVRKIVRTSEIVGETPSGLSRQGDRAYSHLGISPTITTFDITVPIISTYWRRLTPRECLRTFGGFPEDFKIHENLRVSYKQIGNTVSPAVVEEILRMI